MAGTDIYGQSVPYSLLSEAPDVQTLGKPLADAIGRLGVKIFASAANRGAVLTGASAPQAGMITYLADVRRLELWNGISWGPLDRPPIARLGSPVGIDLAHNVETRVVWPNVEISSGITPVNAAGTADDEDITGLRVDRDGVYRSGLGGQWDPNDAGLRSMRIYIGPNPSGMSGALRQSGFCVAALGSGETEGSCTSEAMALTAGTYVFAVLYQNCGVPLTFQNAHFSLIWNDAPA